jgi:hypothetical protein
MIVEKQVGENTGALLVFRSLKTRIMPVIHKMVET